jgi:Flp pilus assembly pilin Flp
MPGGTGSKGYFVEAQRGWLGQDEAATAVEYAIMAALIAVVIIVSVTALGLNMRASYECTASKVGALESTPGDPDC